MTINQLHKIIGKLIDKGFGRSGVYISKDTFTHPLENDGATILFVERADLASFPLIDADGGTDVDSKGREKYSVALLLEGGPHGEAFRGGNWIPVEERLPTHLHSVLGYVTESPLVTMEDPMIDCVSYNPDDKVWLQSLGTEDAHVTVTHWIPLPFPPLKRKHR